MPTHFIFHTNQADGKNWVALAKLQLSKLKRRGKSVAHYRIDADNYFLIQSTRSQDFIHIWAGTPVVKKFAAGLIDVISLTDPIILEDKKNRVPRVYPRKIVEGSDIFGPFENSTILVPNLRSSSNSVIDKVPGLYTGEMRKVVQAIIATGEPVSYEFSFSKTHGVFTSNDGVKWLIEIGVSGVLAKKLSICSDASIEGSLNEDLENELGYKPGVPISPIPVGDSLTTAIVSGSVKVLASPEDLSPFYFKTAFFPACGWAFNSVGSQAINTVYDQVSTYINSYYYKLDISQSNSEPNKAVLTLVESDVLYGDRVSHFKFPNYGLNSLVSFDLFYTPTPPSTPSNGVFYVFFDNDTPVVCRQKGPIDFPETTNNDADDFGNDAFRGENVLVTETNDPVNHVGSFIPKIQSLYGATRSEDFVQKTSSPNYPQVDGVFTQPIDFDEQLGTIYDVTRTTEVDNFFPYFGLIGNPDSDILAAGVILDGVKEIFGGTASDNTKRTTASVLVPFWDREAVFFYEHVIERRSSGSQIIIQTDEAGVLRDVIGHISPAATTGTTFSILDLTAGGFVNGGDGLPQVADPNVPVFSQNSHRGYPFSLFMVSPPVIQTVTDTETDWTTRAKVGSFVTEGPVLPTGELSNDAVLTLIASGAISQEVNMFMDQLTTNSFTAFVDGGALGSQSIQLVRDVFSNEYFCSNDINGAGFPNFFIEGLVNYPVNELTANKLGGRLFMGIPVPE